MMLSLILFLNSEQSMQVSYHRQFEKDLDKYASPEQIQEIFDFVDNLEKQQSLRNIEHIKKLS